MNKAELQNEIARLAKLIDLPEEDLEPISDKPLEERSTIVLDNGLLKLVFMERGDVSETFSTRNPDELLYYLFRRNVQYLARKMSIESDYGNLDKRRVWFKRARELFLKIDNPSWQKRYDQEIEEELLISPYNDA